MIAPSGVGEVDPSQWDVVIEEDQPDDDDPDEDDVGDQQLDSLVIRIPVLDLKPAAVPEIAEGAQIFNEKLQEFATGIIATMRSYVQTQNDQKQKIDVLERQVGALKGNCQILDTYIKRDIVPRLTKLDSDLSKAVS